MAAAFLSSYQMSATSPRHSCPIFTTSHILTPAISFPTTSGGGCSPSRFRISMAKGKDVRITVTLECIGCVRSKAKGVSRYITEKNRHNTPNRIELKKFCPYCNKHTVHGEIKK